MHHVCTVGVDKYTKNTRDEASAVRSITLQFILFIHVQHRAQEEVSSASSFDETAVTLGSNRNTLQAREYQGMNKLT